MERRRPFASHDVNSGSRYYRSGSGGDYRMDEQRSVPSNSRGRDTDEIDEQLYSYNYTVPPHSLTSAQSIAAQGSQPPHYNVTPSSIPQTTIPPELREPIFTSPPAVADSTQ